MSLALFLRKAGRRAAFSLVEVTLSIGLVAFGLVTVLALLPVGLQALGESSQQTVEAQILRAVSAQCLVAEYGEFPTLLHFDYAGQATPAASYYEVTVASSAPVYPGSSEGHAIADSLSRVRVSIAAKPEAGVVRSLNHYTLLVSNQGK